MVSAATAADVYAHPRAELARLNDLGLMHWVATGFYLAVPDDQVGAEWMPGLEAAAAGIAVAAYSADDAVGMGVSAARLHGAVPRALATAVVAVPTRHDPIRLAYRQALGRFVVRDTARLDAERIDTELGAVLVTTAEQTVLDLVKRPGLGDAEGEVWPAVEQLYRRCDRGVLAEIAGAQKMRTTLVRLQRSSCEYGDFPSSPTALRFQSRRACPFCEVGEPASAKRRRGPMPQSVVRMFYCRDRETRRDREDARCR